MPKKNENPFKSAPATEIKPSDLVAENIPAASVAPAGEQPQEKAAEIEPPQEPVATPVNSAEPAIQADATPTADTGGTQAATVVTPSQLVTESLPPAAAQLPPAPGQEKKRGRGRPPGSTNKNKAGEQGQSSIVIPNGNETGEENPDAPQPEKPPVNHRQLAEITFDLTTNSLAVMVGPEWKASSPDEREAMLVPLEMYLKTKQMDDIPPGAILCFAIASYTAPRLRAPATASKIKLGWAWLRSKWAGRKQYAAPRVVESDNGNPFSAKN
jgi:hypothetical protein